ncbi:MAG: ACP S-malonyltransferase [Verrucomicrobiales bacterium]|nr:ACP S-malonyltransferase [Verrucomicrobiales bacterium]
MAKTALLFAGQGAQVVGMGKDLAEAHPTAKSLFAEADEALGYGLSEICFSGPEEELVRTEHAQPAIYLVGWIALQLLREQAPSISFEATAGLSLGEFTALAAADAIGFEDGLRVVRRRGKLMQEACEASSGGMAAIVGLDEEAVRGVCEQAGVSLANLNCPGQIVLSGDADKMDAACEAAKAAGAKRAIPLPVAGAYHSPLMQPSQAGLAEALAKVELREPSVPVYSNVTGQAHVGAASIAGTMVDQVTSSVRWEACIRAMIADGVTRFIELGPGTALTGFMRRIDRGLEVLNVADNDSLAKSAEALNA